MLKMKIFIWTLLAVSFCVMLVSGCQGPQKTVTQEASKVFYPPAPGKPRLQFLKSISSSEDLGEGASKVSGFEKFLVGEDVEKKDLIGKTYGVALYDGKLYVCDVEKKKVEILDLRNKTFGYMTKDRRLVNPVNICIDNGNKFIADSIAGAVFVFGAGDQLQAILGKDLDIKPIDVAVRGNRCYVTDMKSNQVVVLDTTTGTELLRMGAAGDGAGQFGLIADLALDADENVYVTDKGLAKINIFDRDGVFKKSFGQVGDSIYDFVRPKGITVDRSGNIWVVDAAPEVAKIYNPEGQLLMFFGLPGAGPGNMNLPATIIIDYDHADLFKEYFAEGAQIEFLVIVSNQYGPKINVYGFGQFPVQEKQRDAAAQLSPGLHPVDETQTEEEQPQDLE